MEKSIAIVLDLRGTICGVMLDEGKELFKRIEALRVKFNAEKVYISISTHDTSLFELQNTCFHLAQHLNEHIVFGPHFFYDGIYDYKEKKMKIVRNGFNEDKLAVAFDYYTTQIEGNQFIAIIDDEMYDSDILPYQDKHPFLCGVPNSHANRDFNNIMYIVSDSYCTPGIIKIIDEYLERTKEIKPEDILAEQSNIDLSGLKQRIIEKKWNSIY